MLSRSLEVASIEAAAIPPTVALPVSDDMGHDAPHHRGFDCVDAQSCSSTTSALRLQDWLAYPVIEPGSWAMERKMLLTIEQRSESLARQPPSEPS